MHSSVTPYARRECVSLSVIKCEQRVQWSGGGGFGGVEWCVVWCQNFKHDLHSQCNVLKRWQGERDSQDAALETQFLWWIARSYWITNCSLPPSLRLPFPPKHLLSPPPPHGSEGFFFGCRVKIFLNLSLNLICWMWEGERISRPKSIHPPSPHPLAVLLCIVFFFSPQSAAGSVIFKKLLLHRSSVSAPPLRSSWPPL